MRPKFHLLICALLAAAVSGCAIGYHPPLQQGNLVNKETVEQLKVGMTRQQVLALMGTPSIASPFDHARWDYVHAFAINGGKMQVRRMTLYFDNDTLKRIQGSLFAADNQAMLEQARKIKAAQGGDLDQNQGDKSNGDED